jgi:hypothetical protein
MYEYMQARLAELHSSQPLFERMFRQGKVSSRAFFVDLNQVKCTGLPEKGGGGGVMSGINRTVLPRIKSVFFISFKRHSLYCKEPFPAFRYKRGSFYFDMAHATKNSVARLALRYFCCSFTLSHTSR